MSMSRMHPSNQLGMMRSWDVTDKRYQHVVAPLGTGSSGEKAERKHWAACGLKSSWQKVTTAQRAAPGFAA